MSLIRKEIYNKLKTIVDKYRNNGVSVNSVKKYFSSKKNFKELIRSISDLSWSYEKNKEEGDDSFENVVRDILFDRLLLDRMYYDRDRIDESISLSDIDMIETAIETHSTDEAIKIYSFLKNNFNYEIGYWPGESESYFLKFQKDYKYIILHNGKISLADDNFLRNSVPKKIIVDASDIELSGKFIRKMNLVDDPFGEENYGYDQIKENFIFGTSFAVRIHDKDDYDNLMKVSEESGYLWYGGDIPTNLPYDSDDEIICFGIDGRITSSSDADYYDHIKYGVAVGDGWTLYSFTDCPFNKKYTKIINLEDDPYGEENYGVIIKEDVKIKEKLAIYIHDEDQYRELMEELERSGYRWAGGDRPTTIEYDGIGDDVVYIRPEKNISITSIEYYYKYRVDDYRLIEYKRISSGLKKRQRVLNPDDDPFGEENWGFML